MEVAELDGCPRMVWQLALLLVTLEYRLLRSIVSASVIVLYPVFLFTNGVPRGLVWCIVVKLLSSTIRSLRVRVPPLVPWCSPARRLPTAPWSPSASPTSWMPKCRPTFFSFRLAQGFPWSLMPPFRFLLSFFIYSCAFFLYIFLSRRRKRTTPGVLDLPTWGNVRGGLFPLFLCYGNIAWKRWDP